GFDHSGTVAPEGEMNMKKISALVTAVLMLVLVGGAVLAESGDALYSQALVKEKTGSYEEAIKLYQSILQKYTSDKKLAAKALFQIGQDYERLGNAVDARKAYARIANEFNNQNEVVAAAGKRLAALSVQYPAEKIATRFVMSSTFKDTLNRGSLSSDGRWMV